MRNSLSKIIAPILVSFAISGSAPIHEVHVGDRMPYLPKFDFWVGWARIFKQENRPRITVQFYDYDGNRNYDIAAAYLVCDSKKETYLISEAPFGVFYRWENRLYLDNNPTDGVVDKIIRNPGKRSISKDAPSCPK